MAVSFDLMSWYMLISFFFSPNNEVSSPGSLSSSSLGAVAKKLNTAIEPESAAAMTITHRHCIMSLNGRPRAWAAMRPETKQTWLAIPRAWAYEGQISVRSKGTWTPERPHPKPIKHLDVRIIPLKV